jgi:MAF protein
MKPLLLASSSKHRKSILKKLHLPFISVTPNVDERPTINEHPKQLALRLATQKAHVLANMYPNYIIIGSDQVACLDNQLLGKPMDRDHSIQQLKLQSGNSVDFYTSLCVLNTENNQFYTDIDISTVHFRKLTEQQITHYVDIDQPYDCAAAFKSESLGIALLTKIEGDDPNALIGLPLIKLITLLNKFGIKTL